MLARPGFLNASSACPFSDKSMPLTNLASSLAGRHLVVIWHNQLPATFHPACRMKTKLVPPITVGKMWVDSYAPVHLQFSIRLVPRQIGTARQGGGPVSHSHRELCRFWRTKCWSTSLHRHRTCKTPKDNWGTGFTACVKAIPLRASASVCAKVPATDTGDMAPARIKGEIITA